MPCRRQQTTLVGGRDRGGAVVDPELGIDMYQVRFHRGFGDEQPGGRSPVRQTLGDQPQHLQLSLAEWLLLLGRRANLRCNASTATCWVCLG